MCICDIYCKIGNIPYRMSVVQACPLNIKGFSMYRQQMLTLVFIDSLPNTVIFDVIMPLDDVYVLMNIPREVRSGSNPT